MRAFLYLALGAALTCGCARTTDESPATVDSTQSSFSVQNDADNTAINARDRDGSAPTPLDQGNSQADIDTTATIRSRVLEKSLSINGQNVKIITLSGKVTLRGPVKNQAEKETIERIATEVAGADNVTSMLETERS